MSLALPGRPSAPVIPEGVTHGSLAIPGDVGTLGWWIGGAGVEAGQGSVVIVGHVDSAAQGLGYFANLRDVAPGARIVVTGADGGRHVFVVTGRRSYSKEQGLPPAVFDQSIQRRLVLITCTGHFDRAAHSYDDNLVVYALPA